MYENNGYTNYEFIQQPAQEGSGCYPYANYTVPQEPKRDKKHGGRLKTAALILACSLLSGCVGAAAVSPAITRAACSCNSRFSTLGLSSSLLTAGSSAARNALSS